MINTSECEECRYGTLREESKARIFVYCSYKEKEYWFGQCIQCENKTKKIGDSDAEVNRD